MTMDSRWVYFWARNSSTGYMFSNLHQLRISCLTEKRAACCKPDASHSEECHSALGKIQGLQTSRNCSKYEDLSKRDVTLMIWWKPWASIVSKLEESRRMDNWTSAELSRCSKLNISKYKIVYVGVSQVTCIAHGIKSYPKNMNIMVYIYIYRERERDHRIKQLQHLGLSGNGASPFSKVWTWFFGFRNWTQWGIHNSKVENPEKFAGHINKKDLGKHWIVRHLFGGCWKYL